jgi:hypothetical protein
MHKLLLAGALLAFPLIAHAEKSASAQRPLLSKKSYATARAAALGTGTLAIDKLSGEKQVERTLSVTLNSKSKNGKIESFFVDAGPYVVNSQKVVHLKSGLWKGYVTTAGNDPNFQ